MARQSNFISLLIFLILSLSVFSQAERNQDFSPRKAQGEGERSGGGDSNSQKDNKDDDRDREQEKDKDKDNDGNKNGDKGAFNNTLAGRTFRATFTWYGTNDARGSPNCNSNSVACGFYTFPGFSAAASQNLFGVEKDRGAGPSCGTCWRLEPQTDKDGKDIRGRANSIVVLVNNLCPATSDNPLCSQPSLNATNEFGGAVDINVCNDSGAKAALFGSSGVELAVGNATQVDCGQWEGTRKFDAGSQGGSSNSLSSSASVLADVTASSSAASTAPASPSAVESSSTTTAKTSTANPRGGQIGSTASPINVGNGVIGGAMPARSPNAGVAAIAGLAGIVVGMWTL